MEEAASIQGAIFILSEVPPMPGFSIQGFALIGCIPLIQVSVSLLIQKAAW